MPLTSGVMRTDRERQAIKRAINAEGVHFFGGYYLPEDIPTVQALSAKTDETVARIKERVNE